MHQKLYSKLQKEVGRSRSSIESFLKNAPNKYKVYTIPKKTSGHRVIAHPSKELKIFQRTLNKLLENTLTTHYCSIAYKKKLSIKDNAIRHSKNAYLLKIDFSDFFNSIDPYLFFSICELRQIHFSDAEKKLLKHLLFWNKTKSVNTKLVLSVGAPSSPMISNFIMCIFDMHLYDYCRNIGVIYTRYADDLTFSTNKKDILFELPKVIESLLVEYYFSKIRINPAKTFFSSKAHNRHVTGITISNSGSLSLGRDRKRIISAMVHKFKIGKLNNDDFKHLQGLISFANHIEPQLIEKFKLKYGCEVMQIIIKGQFNE